MALQSAGQSVLDLEGLAHHKGSAFGNIGQPEQPSQEQFENKLSLDLSKLSMNSPDKIWVEDESQRIGRLNVPGPIWEQMRSAAVLFLEIPFEERLKYIVKGYGFLEAQRLIDATDRIRKKLGDKYATDAIEYISNGQILPAFDILLRYYDKLYLKSLFNRENAQALIQVIEATEVNESNIQLLLNHRSQ